MIEFRTMAGISCQDFETWHADTIAKTKCFPKFYYLAHIFCKKKLTNYTPSSPSQKCSWVGHHKTEKKYEDNLVP